MRHLWALLVFGGVVSWIEGELGAPVRLVQDAIRAVRTVVTTVWQLLVALYHLVGHAWDDMVGAAEALAKLLNEFGRAVYTHARWLLTSYLPRLGDWLTRRAIGVAQTFGKWALAAAARLLADLARWAATALHTVEIWARDAVGWLDDRLHTAEHWIDTAGATVWHLLSDLPAFAEHLAGMLVRPLLRYAEANAVALARWLWRHTERVSVDAFDVVERILAGLL